MDLPVPEGALWRLFGLVLYLIGLAVSLFVVVDIFANGERALGGELAAQRVAVLLVSIVLIVLGRAITWKFGNKGVVSPGRPPHEQQQTPLERMGYVTPEPPEGAPPEPRGDAESVVCSECGTRNERGFTYCHNCSAELPD